VADLFNDTPSTTVSPLTGAATKVPPKLDEVTPWIYRTGLEILPGNLEIYRMDMGSGQGRELRLKRYLEIMAKRNQYDYVIIDTPPTPSTFMNSALLASHNYLVPVKPEPLSRVGIDLLKGVIDRIAENHGHDIDCVGVVVTMADARTKVYYDALEFLDQDKYWKNKRYRSVFPHRTQVARDQGDQRLILDGGNEDAMFALVGIMKELQERVGDDL
jgi:chromosome partitioning protein